MKTAVAVGLAIAGVVAAVVAGWMFASSGALAGCDIHLVSEARAPHAFRVEFRGETREGTLEPGERETVDLCFLAPRDAPLARVVVDRVGNATVVLDPFCSDPEVLVTDAQVVVGGRACA